jgi:hypothetical protein
MNFLAVLAVIGLALLIAVVVWAWWHAATSGSILDWFLSWQLFRLAGDLFGALVEWIAALGKGGD